MLNHISKQFVYIHIISILAFVGIAQAIAQTVSQEASAEHPYDIALDYCSDRGGLARYSVSGSTVAFSCQDDISNIVSIELGK